VNTFVVIFLCYVGILPWIISSSLGHRSIRRFLYLLFFPITIPAFFLIMGIEHYWLADHFFRRAMRSADRFLPRSTRPAAGTILIDTAAPNHIRTHVWWTQDDIPSISPIPVPAWHLDGVTAYPEQESTEFDYPPFQRWLWNTYLNRDNGSAKLVECRLKPLSIAHMKSRSPTCKVIRSYSGGTFLAELYRREKANDGFKS